MKKDYLIPELEERLKRSEELKIKIKNPEPDRLLSVHRDLEKKLEELMDDRTTLYKGAKELFVSKLKLVHRTDKNEIGVIWSWSQAGHPEIRYADEGRFTIPIATSRNVPFVELNPKEFMEKIAKGDFKPLDPLCLYCHKPAPYGNKTCPDCGRKL